VKKNETGSQAGFAIGSLNTCPLEGISDQFGYSDHRRPDLAEYQFFDATKNQSKNNDLIIFYILYYLCN